jgi:hypothetical protein
MINLIPPAARKSVVREYWIRVVSVWLLLFGTGCFIVTVLLLPTFMIVHGHIKNLDGQVSVATEKTASYTVSATELTKANTDALLLMGAASTSPFSLYLKLVESLTGTSITLNSVRYTSDSGVGGKMTVTGMATTRQTLASFRDALEADPVFMTVVLPISSLTKATDVLFSMDITLATTTTP